MTTAGIYVEAFICAVATLFWVVSYPDTLLHEIAFKTMLFTGVSTVFFNINPLIKIDGYYALSSIVEIPDLREDAFRYIGAWFQKHVLRLPVEVPPVSRRKRRIYWIYGSLALAWIAVVMRVHRRALFQPLSPLLPELGGRPAPHHPLPPVSQARAPGDPHGSNLFYLDKKELLMSPRIRTALLAGAVALVLLLVVPWSRRTLGSPAVLRPLTTVRLEAPEDAVVTRALAEEGDRVEAGQPVFQLVSASATEETAAPGVRARAPGARGQPIPGERRARPGFRLREPGRFRRCGLGERQARARSGCS